jgi:hypothetical protein
MSRLGHTDAHCAALFALPGAVAPAAPGAPPAAALAQESLQGYVMLLSGHFQGFCRDLYTECTQICAAAVPAGLRTTIQAQFAAELKLNTKNPTVENIRKDFERFGFLLDLVGADPGNRARITHVGHMNYWRNAAAHQKASPPPAGVPAVLSLADIQAWRASCDGLSKSLDDIMRKELIRILGAAPW